MAEKFKPSTSGSVSEAVTDPNTQTNGASGEPAKVKKPRKPSSPRAPKRLTVEQLTSQVKNLPVMEQSTLLTELKTSIADQRQALEAQLASLQSI